MREKRDPFGECHPALQFAYFVIVLLTTVFTNHPVILGISFIGALGYHICLESVGQTLKKQVAWCVPMFLLVAMINPLFNHYGVTVLFYLHTGPVTLEAIVYGIVLAGILLVSLLWFSDFNKIFTTDRFVYLFGKMSPGLSMVLSMTLRFVPRFQHQLKEIQKSQKCLGTRESQRNRIGKLKIGVAQVSMLISWALENGIHTANSMRSRGYGVAKRTSYRLYRWHKRDWVAGIFLAAFYGITLYGIITGVFTCQYDPQIIVGGTPFGYREGIIALAWMFCCSFPVVWKGIWQIRFWILLREGKLWKESTPS